MPKIKEVRARQIIDCKCRPIVEVDIETEDGFVGRGSAPTGSSVGMYEAHVLRDNVPNEYDGKSVHKAVSNVLQTIRPAIIGMNARDQSKIDQIMIELDGTPNKKNLGGNAIYSVSIACLRAAAAAEGVPVYKYLCGRDIKTVPVPSFNIINGGRYGDMVQAFNEFLIVPYKAKSIEVAVEIAVKCFHQLEHVITDYQNAPPIIASSYGWASPSNDPEIILELISKAVEKCGYKNEVAFALDCASSEMYDAKTNTYFLKGKQVSAAEQIDYLKKLTEKFQMVFLEDILDENDWDNYVLASKNISKSIIIGDDLIASDPEKIKRAFEMKAASGFILKPNQIGTITEALKTHEFAKEHDMFSITSGRSGGVVDDIVMDLAVGLELGFIKNGAPRSGERIDKLNFLLRASDLSPSCKMADITSIVKF